MPESSPAPAVCDVSPRGEVGAGEPCDVEWGISPPGLRSPSWRVRGRRPPPGGPCRCPPSARPGSTRTRRKAAHMRKRQAPPCRSSSSARLLHGSPIGPGPKSPGPPPPSSDWPVSWPRPSRSPRTVSMRANDGLGRWVGRRRLAQRAVNRTLGACFRRWSCLALLAILCCLQWCRLGWAGGTVGAREVRTLPGPGGLRLCPHGCSLGLVTGSQPRCNLEASAPGLSMRGGRLLGAWGVSAASHQALGQGAWVGAGDLPGLAAQPRRLGG